VMAKKNKISTDSFNEVIKRNKFDLERSRETFYEGCKVIGTDPEVLINKGVELILKAVGVIANSNWEFIKSRIERLNKEESDETKIFLITAGLLLSWEKIEKEGLENNRDYKKMILN
jgi:hypothetical protein